MKYQIRESTIKLSVCSMLTAVYYYSLLPASMDYNMSSTQVVLHSGVTEVACVNITIHRDGTPERVENFYVVGVPNGMAGTPVGGDSCEVLIIDGDGMF